MKTPIIIQIIVLCVICGRGANANNAISLGNLRCEHRINPLVVSSLHPSFSWWMFSSTRNTLQTSYRIVLAEDERKLLDEKNLFWDSRVVKSAASNQVPYSGPSLQSGKRYYWKVKVTDNHGQISDWSEIAWFQMGILDKVEWRNARWIGYEELPDSMKIVPGIHGFGNDLGAKAVKRSVVPLFRKEFALEKPIKKATLYISGLGQYEAAINGNKIGNSFLAPGWTDYDIRALYNVFDVGNQLKIGQNVLGVTVGNGFYNINRERYRKLVIAYGYPKLISKLIIEYSDGTSTELVTDNSWKCAPSPIEYSSIYGGEDYNATLEQNGWLMSGFDDSHWKNAIVVNKSPCELTPELDYPVTVNQSIQVKKVVKKADNRYLFDFGQNGSGIVELQIKGKRGAVVKLIPGELITSDNEINQKASGPPYYYTYTLKGDGIEIWHPQFSYYGFRYVMVEGAEPVAMKANENLPQVTKMTMLHTCNSSPMVGKFTCSNELFNQIYQLIDWAIRSNLQSVVTDCPHREKLGWLEQTYLMGASLHYNYDLYLLYQKAIHDMIDAQTNDGLVPDIAPEYTEFVGGFRDSPEWGSAAVILPYLLWEWYGNQTIIKEAMPMMKKYVSFLGSKANNNILSHGLGDWFDYGPKSPGEAQLTPKALTATAIYYYDVSLLARMMRLCSMNSDADKMDQLAKNIKKSFNDRFFDQSTFVYSTGSQTAMAMPLCTGLVEEKNRSTVFKMLTESIKSSGYALTAGDVGFHFLVKALEEGDGSQILYDMNCRNDLPGYGFQLKKGATALTESWPALEQVSNNHLMLGHLMEWFYAGLAGIKQAEGTTAFSSIIIRPEVVGDIASAEGSYLSPFGIISSSWKKNQQYLEMKVEIPANTNALICFPISSCKEIKENGKKIHANKDKNGKFSYHVGSGKYSFNIEL